MTRTTANLAAGVVALICAAPAAGHAANWTVHEAVGAPANLKLSGSVRVRYETIDGQARTFLPAHEGLAMIRSTLLAEYQTGAVRIGGEIYDSRAYGAKLGSAISANDVNALELVQAYVAADLKTPLGVGSRGTVQAGRFVMNLGSRRLLAADDYRNTTNGYTGVRLDLTGAKGGAGTLFVTAPQVRLPDGQADLLDNRMRFDRESTDLLIWGAIGSRPGPGRTTLEATYMGLKEKDAPGRPTRDRDLTTFAVRVIRNPAPNRFDFEVEGAYQIGSVRAGLGATAAELDVAAGFVHLDAGYQFAGKWKPRLSVDYDYVSGDEGGGRYNRFDSLLGMRRADFAPSGIYATTGRANIASPGLRLEITPAARWDAMISARPMWLASRTDSFSTTGVRDASGRSGRFAGTQVDARLRYWLIPNALRFEADAVWLDKGRLLKAAPVRAGSNADTRYLSLNLTWTF